MQLPQIRHPRKKTLILSTLISGVFFLHLIWVYIFEWGHYVGLPGGSISIGIIGDTPDVMNPLSYGKSPETDLMFHFLFRWILQYNPQTEILEWDLGTCDITNIQKIICSLKENQYWSDGTSIQKDDVIKTYKTFGENTADEKMKTFLTGVSIKTEKNTIILQSKTKNPLILDFLTYPILRTDVLEQIRTKRFATGGYVSSGPFVFSEITEDKEYWFDRITLAKNEKSWNGNIWLDKVHFKFFKNLTSLERSVETLSVIIPPSKNESIQLGWRFEKYRYATYEFFSVFFHTDHLAKPLRNILHWQIGNSLSGSIDPDHRAVISVFQTGGAILPTEGLQNFPDILRKSGYSRKSEILSLIDAESTTVTGSIVYDAPKFFRNKNNALVLFVDKIDKNGIRLSWKPPKGTESITINGRSLLEFKKENPDFFYRISEENKNVKTGKNTYTAEFFNKNKARIAIETLTVYYSTDSDTLAGYKKSIDDEYIARKNTPALIAEREKVKKLAHEKIEKLDERYYYTRDGKPFEITVSYVNGRESTESYAKIVEATLANLSIKTTISAITPEQVSEMIKTGKKDYDILIIGIEAPGNIARIGQTFLSTEAWAWVNFSNIQSKTLDELFTTFRSTTGTGSVAEIQGKIVSIMQKESFFLPISSPLHTLYIDRNLKWVEQIDTIPNISSLWNILDSVSIKDAYIINSNGKWFFNFFSWIWQKAFF